MRAAPALASACQLAYTRPFLATRSATAVGRPPADWLVLPNISVRGAGTAAAPAGAAGVRSASVRLKVRQRWRTREVPVAESGASEPESETRTDGPPPPIRVRPEAVKDTPSGVRPDSLTTSLYAAQPPQRAAITARPEIDPSSRRSSVIEGLVGDVPL